MIHLRLHSEYSFRRVFGKMADVVAATPGEAMALTDDGCWGHVAFVKECKKAGKKALLGVEVLVIQNARPMLSGSEKRSRDPGTRMVLLAKNMEGLRELYAVMTVANSPECFYYVPRLDYTDINALSDNLIILSGTAPDLTRLRNRVNVYLELNPGAPGWVREALRQRGWSYVVTGDNLYPRRSDHSAYEVLAEASPGGNAQRRMGMSHIMSEAELRRELGPEIPEEAYLNTERIAAMCEVKLPKASMVKFPATQTLEEMCREAAPGRHINLSDPVYAARLRRELDLILQKDFADYFYVISDMVRYAKQHMLVGPARGSSAGSLVCYLLGITDVDPIVHDLLFERFIDITRADLPDIDIDFPDTKREMVMAYLVQRYGAERVGRLGTVNTYKAKSAIDDVAKLLKIPAWELNDFKGAIIERSGGDARAQFSVADSFETLDVGKAIVAKYPGLRVAGQLEGHARHAGTHAAGYVITQQPLAYFAPIDDKGNIQVDKYDAEELNILKIDVLGLRTLSVLEDCLHQIGKDRQWLITYPLDDVEAFDVLNQERYSGIFQFEGYALQSLTRQMKIKEFNDIVAITSLARPGPLHSGAATEFIERRLERAAPTPLHPLAEPLTADSQGVVIYQEQVMALGRTIGNLSWEDVSSLRKAMSKSLGDEFFNQYWERFREGAKTHGIVEGEARGIWEKMCTFGSWAFNKSHAVSYGLLSYWCAVLKAHWPLEFAAATLRNAKDDEQPIKLLRELAEEGIPYKPYDPEMSRETWSVANGMLIGGLTNIIGVGVKKAQEMIQRRDKGLPMPPGMRKLLEEGKTPFDDIFEGKRRFADLYANPKAHNIHSGPILFIKDIVDGQGTVLFLGKLVEKNLRDLNEYGSVAKRGGKMETSKTQFLNLRLEDDTGPILATITRWKFDKLGKAIIEHGRIGDWYVWRGVVRDHWRKVYIDNYRKL